MCDSGAIQFSVERYRVGLVELSENARSKQGRVLSLLYWVVGIDTIARKYCIASHLDAPYMHSCKQEAGDRG